MIDSRTRNDLVLKLVFLPSKGSLQDVEQPYIILSPVPRIPSKNNEIRLAKQHTMPIPLPRCVLLIRNLDDLPNRS